LDNDYPADESMIVRVNSFPGSISRLLAAVHTFFINDPLASNKPETIHILVFSPKYDPFYNKSLQSLTWDRKAAKTD